jgi:hypothetical protein
MNDKKTTKAFAGPTSRAPFSQNALLAQQQLGQIQDQQQQ